MQYDIRGHHLRNLFYYLKWDRSRAYHDKRYEKLLSASEIKITDDFDYICSICILPEKQKEKLCKRDRISEKDKDIVQKLNLEIGKIYSGALVVGRLNEYTERFI